MKTIKRTMAIATLLLAMSQSMWAGGSYTYKNMKIAANATPVAAGTVYMMAAEGEAIESGVKTGILRSEDVANAVLELTSSQTELYYRLTANPGFIPVGFVSQETYNATPEHFSSRLDIIGTYQSAGEIGTNKESVKGFYKFSHEWPNGREGITGGGDNQPTTADAWKQVRESTADNIKMPVEPDYTHIALFIPDKDVPAYYFYSYDTNNSQQPKKAGTIGLVSANVDKVDIGGEISLTATPKPGNSLDSWTKYAGDGTVTMNYSRENTITVTAEAGTYYVPTFKVNPITLNADGVVTYSNLKGVKIPDDVKDDFKAYPARLNKEGNIELLSNGLQGIPDSEGNNPENPTMMHGAIIIGTPNAILNLQPIDPLTQMAFYNNKKEGEEDPTRENAKFDYGHLLATAYAPKVADGKQYVLTKKNEKLGFFKMKPGETIPLNKAYIEVDGGSAKDFIGFSEDPTTTAIANIIDMRMAEGDSYNLQGQRVDYGYRGIIIKNGKKYINK